MRETQKEIERIIGFPHNMFKHLIALNTYTEPFLSMKTNDQRDMIEQLLGITEISSKAEVLKSYLSILKTVLKTKSLGYRQYRMLTNVLRQVLKTLKVGGRLGADSTGDKVHGLQTSLRYIRSTLTLKQS